MELWLRSSYEAQTTFPTYIETRKECAELVLFLTYSLGRDVCIFGPHDDDRQSSVSCIGMDAHTIVYQVTG